MSQGLIRLRFKFVSGVYPFFICFQVSSNNILIFFGELEVEAAEGFMGNVVWNTSSKSAVRWKLHEPSCDVLMLKRCMWHLFINCWRWSTNECLSHIFLWSHVYHLTPFPHVFLFFFFPSLKQKPQINFKTAEVFFSLQTVLNFWGEWTLPGIITCQCAPKMAAEVFDLNGSFVFSCCRSAAQTPVPLFCFYKR